MTPSPTTARSLFASLPEPARLSPIEPSPGSTESVIRVNSHIHLPPNFSAFDTVAQAVDLAEAQGVRVLGVSNYYDYSVYDSYADLAARRGIFPLFGLEIICLIDELVASGSKINDPGNPGKMYICGKGIARFSPMDPGAERLLNVIRSKDSERMDRITERLAELFAASGLATDIGSGVVKASVQRRHGSTKESIYLQERHVAQEFQEAVFRLRPSGQRIELLRNVYGAEPKAGADDAAGIQNDIRSFLMKAGKAGYVPETFVDFDHAYRLILALGGIPCYPTLADGASPICPFEAPVERLISELKERGIHAAEFIPVRNSAAVLEPYVLAMRRAGIIVTAGTEHNTRDMIPIEPTLLGGEPISDELKNIFREGACVAAAHQNLVMRGEKGYVDSDGSLNAAYGSDEERITAFRRLGTAAIGAYLEMRR